MNRNSSGFFVNNNNSRLSSAPAALVLLLTAFLPVAMANPTNPTDILFIAYDQGESNAFIRIQDQLDKRNIPYKIIAFGRAAEIFKHHPGLIKITELLDNQTLRNHREQGISEAVAQQVSKTTRAKIIYSGMASKAQAQLMNIYGKNGSHLIAFYDNFDPVESKSYVQPFLSEIDRIDEFHLPSEITATSFSALKQSKKADAIVTGQPVLEGWDEIFDKTDPVELRQKLEISTKQSVVLFAGGYDGDYPNSFRIFLKAAKLMPDTQFLVTHHPKYSGELEQKLMHQEATVNVRLLHSHQASTPELSTLASVVVVHKSTIAQQALYKGKPVIYIANDEFNNFILEKQLANRVHTPEMLKKELDTLLIRNKNQPPSLKPLGIPDNASQRIAELLQNHLKNNGDSQRSP